MSYVKLKKYRVVKEHIQANDMTVELEDGFIKKRVSYYDFINGKVTHTNKPFNMKKRIQKRIGERMVNHSNLIMTIVDYRNANDIDVLFEDGVLVEHVHFAAFFQRSLKHSTKKLFIGLLRQIKN